MPTKTVIKLEDVSLNFTVDHHPIHVLKDISFKVFSHEFFMLLGPSGSGKSSILRLIAGLLKPSKGQVITAPNVRLSFIFQGFALFPWLTVEDNVAFGLHMQGMQAKDRLKIAHAQIARMGLAGFEKAYPRELSGGMKQRVGIARALAVNPDVILLDEPFSALDSFTATKLREDLLKIWHESKLTIIMVTHLIDEAVLLADRIAVMGINPGRIEKIISNDLPRPRKPREKNFYTLSDELAALIKV